MNDGHPFAVDAVDVAGLSDLLRQQDPSHIALGLGLGELTAAKPLIVEINDIPVSLGYSPEVVFDGDVGRGLQHGVNGGGGHLQLVLDPRLDDAPDHIVGNHAGPYDREDERQPVPQQELSSDGDHAEQRFHVHAPSIDISVSR